jgi:hypothetical protein
MIVVIMKEVGLVVVMDDLDFGVRTIAFEAKMFNRYDIFNQITNKSMEYPSYAYLYRDLLDMVALTIIIPKVKSLHINMHE